MANEIEHTFQSAKTQSPDGTIVSKDAWNGPGAHTINVSALQSTLGLAATALSTDAANLTGTLAAARLPQFTGGDVTTAAPGSTNLQIAADAVGSAEIANGAVGTTELADDGVTNAKLANMAAGTVKANLTGAPADPSDATTAALAAAIATQVFAGPGFFGDASDGNATFDGVNPVTGWTRSGSRYFPTARPNWAFNVVTFSPGVTLEMEVGGEGTGGGCSSEFYAQEVIVTSGTATIKHNGATPTTQAVATNMTTGHTGASVGQGAGGIQNAGQNGTNFAGNWYNSRKAGAGGFGGASLTAAGSTAGSVALTTLADSVGLPLTWEQSKVHRLNIGNAGPAAGGGGGGSGAGTVGIASGGAGGNGGGVMTVGIRKFSGPGTLDCQVKGGNGAPGQAGVGSNAGGGSGGGGGEIAVAVGHSTFPGGITVNKSGGTGGAPQGGGSAGGNGVAGQQYLYALGSGA